MGKREIRGLKTRVRRKCSISRGGPDCTVEVYKSEKSEEEITVLQVGTQQGGSSRNESCQRVLNLERKSSEHLRWTHLEQAQHCTDLPCQVTFSANTGQEYNGRGLG